MALVENRKCWIIHGKGGLKPTPLEELHPLLFPPVLNKIFSYLSVWNQKKCRTVCKSWEAELRPFLRLNCKVNLSKLVTSFADEDKEEENQKIDDDDQHHHIKLLNGICQICTSFVIEEEDPIIILHVLLQTTTPPLPLLLSIKYLEIKNFKWELSQITKILRELPHLEELRLPILCSTTTTGKENSHPNSHSPNSTASNNNHNNGTKLCHTNKYISKSASITCNWKRAEVLQNSTLNGYTNKGEELLFLQLKRIIVTLTIRDLQFFDHDSAPIKPILELIRLTPNLEEVYYPNIVQFTSPFDNPARALLQNIINSRQHLRLSILKIDTFLSNSDLKLLTAKRLPFKSLQLTLTPAICVKNLYEFLEISAPTLKSLTLTFRDGFQLSGPFPNHSLSGLESMAIILWNGHFDFLHEIQKLKVLIIVLIEMQDQDHQDEMFQGKLTFHDFRSQSKIQEVEIHGNQRSKVGMAKRILNLMPESYLVKLTLDWVNDDLLEIIFKSLPNLEEFGILYGGFTASGITGISPYLCREEYCDTDRGDIFKEICGPKGRRHGIGDLKRLKSLLLTGDLTNVLIVFGVCHCRSLQRLELTARSSSKIGDVSIKKIAEMNSVEFLRLKNFLDMISQESVAYLKTKFDGREIHLC